MPSKILTENESKAAITESLYQYAAGIDMKNPVLIASVFTPDAISDFRPAAAKAGFDYPVLKGRETITSALMNSLGSLLTTHSVNNSRVFIEGDKAKIDALVEAQHVPKSDASRHYLMKNRYDVELERHNGQWLISCITVDNIWRSGDPAVLAGI
ncbi:nuclear transport factor 2 family protein [Erwinia sp. E_sp_B04_7]|uniref:nuclear transport factor 2 family protein n=1 Tax=unclassified Erwinia TaxID=2622719 RepID=UPI0030CAA2DB